MGKRRREERNRRNMMMRVALILLSFLAFVHCQLPSPYVLPIVVKTVSGHFGIVEIQVDPSDMDKSLLGFGSLASKQDARQILSDSVSSRQPGAFRPDACDGHPVWAAIPHAATNSYDVAANWSKVGAWRGDSRRLRTVENLWDLAKLAADMGLNEGTWVELGVLRGEFSVKLLEIGMAKSLIMVDLWDAVDIYSKVDAEKNLELTKMNMLQFDFSRFEIWKMSTVQASTEVQDGSISFVYIDASHSYADVKADIEAWWPKLKVGGLMGGDDYFNGFVLGAQHSFGVKDAVDEFFNAKKHRVYASGFADSTRSIFQQWYVFKCAE